MLHCAWPASKWEPHIIHAICSGFNHQWCRTKLERLYWNKLLIFTSHLSLPACTLSVLHLCPISSLQEDTDMPTLEEPGLCARLDGTKKNNKYTSIYFYSFTIEGCWYISVEVITILNDAKIGNCTPLTFMCISNQNMFYYVLYGVVRSLNSLLCFYFHLPTNEIHPLYLWSPGQKVKGNPDFELPLT